MRSSNSMLIILFVNIAASMMPDTTTNFYTPPTTTCPTTTSTTPLPTTSSSTSTTPLPTTSPSPPGVKIWGLLVAGSNGYYNYRHQADICHAYQILHENGIPDENIIVMMFDDVANNEDNPIHGVIINSPGGPNVYKNVLKDYTGEDVTSTNFLNVLKGNKEAMIGIGSGRVIESGPNDHIFVNFADHGGPGALMFPNDELLADKLISTFKEMVANNKFNKMVLYVEACFSGSMFETLLPDDINIFVTTAADPHESSYACYYDEELGTYLGDVFSVNWMEDTEKENLNKESLNKQFEVVRAETRTSHVEEYGDLDIGSSKLGNFIGIRNRLNKFKNATYYNDMLSKFPDAVPSQDVPIEILKRKLKLSKNKYSREYAKLELNHIIKKRKMVDKLFYNLITDVSAGNVTAEGLLNNFKGFLNNDNFPCYRSLFTYFSENCFSIAKNPYVAVHLNKFVNFCSLPWTREPTMINAIDKYCSDEDNRIDVTNSVI